MEKAPEPIHRSYGRPAQSKGLRESDFSQVMATFTSPSWAIPPSSSYSFVSRRYRPWTDPVGTMAISPANGRTPAGFGDAAATSPELHSTSSSNCIEPLLSACPTGQYREARSNRIRSDSEIWPFKVTTSLTPNPMPVGSSIGSTSKSTPDVLQRNPAPVGNAHHCDHRSSSPGGY